MNVVVAIVILAGIGAIVEVAKFVDLRSCDECFVISQQESILPNPSLDVWTSVDRSSIAQGRELTISWMATNAPAGSAVALFPQKVLTGHVFDPIAAALAPTGRYVW